MFSCATANIAALGSLPGGAAADVHAGGVPEGAHGGGHQHVRRSRRVGPVRRLPAPADGRQLTMAQLAHQKLQALQRVLRTHTALSSVLVLATIAQEHCTLQRVPHMRTALQKPFLVALGIG